MVDRNAVVPEDKRITFRMGVNLGDVIADGGDIYGDGVNIAARLEALAEPGGVCNLTDGTRPYRRTGSPIPSRTSGNRASKTLRSRFTPMHFARLR